MAISPSVINGDFYFSGTCIFAGARFASGTMTDDSVVALANIAASKLEQQVFSSVNLSNHATLATAMRVPIHRVNGTTGTLIKFGVTCTVLAGGGGSATIDLKKNGTTILTGTFNIDSTATVYTLVEPAGFTSTSLVAGDQLDVEVTAVAGTAPKGLTAWMVSREKAQ